MGEHFYLWSGAVLLFLFFAVYVFWYEHKRGISHDQDWVERFKIAGIDPRDITHDEGVWYYKRRSTCVGYGDWDDECPRHENYCSGRKTFGDAQLQVTSILRAINNNGTHPECPLVYTGAS